LAAESVASELRRAVGIALRGDWKSAHEIAQQHEDDPQGQWLHAIVHRMEGDLDNARYWYGRCGRRLPQGVTTEDELQEIRAALGQG